MVTTAVAEGLSFGGPFYLGLLVAGLAVMAAVGALSHQHAHAFSASVIYLTIGLGAALIVEAVGVDWLEPSEDSDLLEHLSELALIIALFGTGLKLDRALTLREWSGVGRLLLVAMPLTIGAVALFGSLVMGLGAGAAIMLGAWRPPTRCSPAPSGSGRPATRRSASRTSRSRARPASTTGWPSRSCCSAPSWPARRARDG